MSIFWQAQQDAGTPSRFTYKAPPIACVGPSQGQFLMGGVSMATHIDALQRFFDKPLLWATIQFLNPALLGDDMVLEIETVGGGRNVVQAMVTMRRANVVLHRTLAALGQRGDEADRAFVTVPKVARPNDCPEKAPDLYATKENLIGQFERKTAFEDATAGIEHMWIRADFAPPIDAAYLSLVSDFFLGAHERTRRGTSLDNTFRLINTRPTEWVLAVTHMSSFTRGAAQGNMHLFAEDGTLLAASSQTGLLPRPLE